QNTGVYLDGVEVPLLYHFGGLTSVVNPEFLEDISFFPGGFGPYYGRATAGIVDVKSRDMNLRTYRGYAEVDLIDSGFFFGGPVKVGQLPTFTFAAAARRSYIDALIPLALDVIVGPEGQSVVASPVYWDYQVKIETSPLPGQRFSLFAFGSDDDLRVISRGTGVGNDVDLGVKSTWHRLVGRWESRLPGNLVHFTQPFVGLNLNNIELGSDIGLGATIEAGLVSWGVRDELRFSPSDLFDVAIGADYQGDTFGGSFSIPLPLEIGSFPRVQPRVPKEDENQVIESTGLFNAMAVYAEAQVEALPGVRIIPGVRAELTLVHFPAEELPDGELTDARTVQLWNVDPRITARWQVLRGTALKGAFGVYRQAPTQQLSPEAGNPYLLPERSLQYIAGVEQNLTDVLNLDLQLYYYDRDLLWQDSDEVVLRGDGSADPLFFTNEGVGRTFGLELLLRHELSKYFFGWIAYTLSRSEIDVSERRESLVLTSFDQTHILTVVGQVNLPFAISLGGRFRLVSGNPSSRPIGSVHDLDTSNYQQYSTRFGTSRLPAFHQLDVRVDKKWVWNAFSMTTYLDLLNVYNQQNAEGFQNDYRFRERQPIPSLPILPVIGASGEF
ncbi:MAG: TonB-dependent receptor plug domain-containing protein, partial [Myxococcota bacterium]